MKSKEQIKKADGFVRKLAQIVYCYRGKYKQKRADSKHIEEFKDVPALEYLSNEINKLIHGQFIKKHKNKKKFNRPQSEERHIESFSNASPNVFNDSFSGMGSVSDFKSLPNSKDQDKTKENSLLSTPVKWTTDEDPGTCESCHKEFTWFRWKHNCIMCGKLVCDDCSPYKDYVIGYSDNKVRQCKECHSTNQKKSKQKD